MADPLAVLATTRFVLLTTFRRNGTAVPTPVWVVRDGDQLLVWTNAQSGKVKRIRANGRVELVPCSRRGIPMGRSVAGTARVLEPADVDQILPALIDKYGLLAQLTSVPDRLKALVRRPVRPPGGLAITLD